MSFTCFNLLDSIRTGVRFFVGCDKLFGVIRSQHTFMETQMWSFPKFSKTSKYFNTIVDFRLAICFTEKLEPSTHGFFVVRKTVQEMGPFMQGEN